MRGRAWRRHQVQRVARNRRPLDWRSEYPDIAEPMSDNELATRHPLDCGSRCLMCHGDKLLNAGARRARWRREAADETAVALDRAGQSKRPKNAPDGKV